MPTPAVLHTMKTVSHPSPSPRITARAAALGALAAAAALVAGCNLPTSTEPIGGKPKAVEAAEFDGMWRSADGTPVFVRVVDPAAGRLEMAIVGTNEAGFNLDRSEVLLRQEGDAVLVNLRGEDDADAGYTFGRLTGQGEGRALLFASTDALRDLALQGRITASITTNTGGNRPAYEVRVTGQFDRLAAEIAGTNGWSLLHAAEPWILVREKAGLR